MVVVFAGVALAAVACECETSDEGPDEEEADGLLVADMVVVGCEQLSLSGACGNVAVGWIWCCWRPSEEPADEEELVELSAETKLSLGGSSSDDDEGAATLRLRPLPAKVVVPAALIWTQLVRVGFCCCILVLVSVRSNLVWFSLVLSCLVGLVAKFHYWAAARRFQTGNRWPQMATSWRARGFGDRQTEPPGVSTSGRGPSISLRPPLAQHSP